VGDQDAAGRAPSREDPQLVGVEVRDRLLVRDLRHEERAERRLAPVGAIDQEFDEQAKVMRRRGGGDRGRADAQPGPGLLCTSSSSLVERLSRY
jgi:hypothetical protein